MRSFLLGNFPVNVTVMLGLFAPSFALAQTAMPQAAASQPVCIYSSATYSEGASICAQKSMMLTCQVDGAKATWKTITDKDLNDRCLAPTGQQQAQRRARFRHFTSSQVYPDSSAKCFNFNGKRYCE